MHLRRSLTAFCMFVMMLQFAPLSFAEGLPTNTKTSTVFIGLYDRDGHFTGWGSGFFVDEGIVITNKHVIEGARYYRIFATNSDGKVDLNCYKDLTKADIKVNLEDDVAYIRVYLSCAHGIAEFSDTDPPLGSLVSVIGYPDRGSVSASLALSTTTGSVTGITSGPWLKTDAYVHFGNSGGPVLSGDAIVGVAVAKGVDQSGKFITGLFIPVSIIIKGLEYANDSSFGYVPRVRKSGAASGTAPIVVPFDSFNPQRLGTVASNAQCKQSLGQGAESTGYAGCRCIASYHREEKECLPGAPGWKDPAFLPRVSSARSRAFSSLSSVVRRKRVKQIPKRAVKKSAKSIATKSAGKSASSKSSRIPR